MMCFVYDIFLIVVKSTLGVLYCVIVTHEVKLFSFDVEKQSVFTARC